MKEIVGYACDIPHCFFASFDKKDLEIHELKNKNGVEKIPGFLPQSFEELIGYEIYLFHNHGINKTKITHVRYDNELYSNHSLVFGFEFYEKCSDKDDCVYYEYDQWLPKTNKTDNLDPFRCPNFLHLKDEDIEKTIKIWFEACGYYKLSPSAYNLKHLLQSIDGRNWEHKRLDSKEVEKIIESCKKEFEK